MGSSSLGVSPHQVGKTKARIRWSRPGQLLWGNLARGLSGLGRGYSGRRG